jgi:hypothetical protein
MSNALMRCSRLYPYNSQSNRIGRGQVTSDFSYFSRMARRFDRWSSPHEQVHRQRASSSTLCRGKLDAVVKER